MKKARALLILCVLLLAGTAGNFVSMLHIDRQTERTTTGFLATISEISADGMGENKSAEIKTMEFSAPLRLPEAVARQLGTGALSALQSDETIFFRVENRYSGQMESVPFIPIVSLRTETKDIFTLADCNAAVGKSVFPARIACVAEALLLLSGLAACALSIRKREARMVTGRKEDTHEKACFFRDRHGI